jgi:antibiotic biosynthesis monooxygenase (ABM) superfamily enzyme
MSPDQPQPSRHRMAALTWLGICPLVSVLLRFLAPDLTTLPFLARTALITAAAVLAMTYLVMPRLVRLAALWPPLSRPARRTPDIRRTPRNHRYAYGSREIHRPRGPLPLCSRERGRV